MSTNSRWEDFKTSLKPRVAEWRFMLRRLRQSTLALVGLGILLVFVGIACLAPVLAPPQSQDPFNIPLAIDIAKLTSSPVPPVQGHIFGTTDLQYDLYYACIWGTLTAFRTGLLVVSISLLIGLLLGTIAAYYGGLLDEALMRFTDIIIAFPGLILSMALVIALPAAFAVSITVILIAVGLLATFLEMFFHMDRRLMLITQIILAFGIVSLFFYPLNIGVHVSRLDKVLISITIVGWPGYTRVIRGEVLRVKNEDYIEAAKASGSSDSRVILKHIWPNTIYPLLIVATLDIGSIVLSAAALSFLGLGADANFADWGQIIQRSNDWISQPSLLLRNMHTFLIPGLFISFFVMGWNLLGDALRDVLDPTLRRK